MEVGEGSDEPATVSEDQVITIRASSLLPEAAGMAAQTLCAHIYLCLLMSFFVGGSSVPCEQHLRSRKPLLESLQWETYWVPLMIILGGCCAVAWSILFLAYEVGQKGGKVLPQIPAAQEEEEEEEQEEEEQEEGGPRQTPPDKTKEDSNLPESKNSKVNLPESKNSKVNLPESKNSKVNLPESKNSKVNLLESKNFLGTPLQTKGSRERIELSQKGSQEAVGNPQQSEEKSQGAKEGLENQLGIKRFQDGVEDQLERKGSWEGIGSPFLQGEDDPTSFRPNGAEDPPCGKLWTTMEKELERLLKLLRFSRSSGPGPVVEEILTPAVEETTPPPATETPKPATEEIPPPIPTQEPLTVPTEETPRSLSSGQSPATVHLIICGLRSSACQNRSQRRRDGSRRRK